MRTRTRFCAFLCLLWLSAAAQANVTLRHIFSDNMVLQQGQPVPVFGTADLTEKITVTIAGQKADAVPEKDGTWVANLPALRAGGPFELVVRGTNTITLKNVLVGEVWIASGQSNMGFQLRQATTGAAAIANSANPMLRLFSVPLKGSPEPLADVNASWVEANPQTTPNFTAVGYFFARDLQKALGVPVGIINSSWGGTPAEAWTRPDFFTDPEYKATMDGWTKQLADYPAALEKYRTVTLPKWQEAVKQAKADGKPEPRRPNPPNGPDSQNRPGNLYNGMIYPLVPFAVKGAVWYQGEANSGRAYAYRKLLPAMVRTWRESFRQPQLSFYIAELAPYMAIKAEPSESTWAELREAQFLCTKALSPCGVAVTTDVGDPNDIHPKHKEPVGARLALQALAKTYGRQVVCDGPTYRDLKIEGAKARVGFDHADGGLVCRGDKLTGWAICGADRKWVNADAVIDGASVVVSSAAVTAPVAVRYAWADCPVVNLWNGAGLPAIPFRTDEWPGLTWPKPAN